jgi:hypothetical protein
MQVIPTHPSRHFVLVIVCTLMMVSFLLMGTNQNKPMQPVEIAQVAPLPDYARYHWEGYHRQGPLQQTQV